jgi:elongation factor G
MRLEVEMPAEAADDVIADLKTRRATTLQTSVHGKYGVATALVPLANLYGYENAFRGLTKGAGSVQFSFVRYERIIGSDPDDTHPGAAIGLRPA